MSIPTDTAARSAARDASTASETPKPGATSRSAPNSTGAQNPPHLAGSLQALKELALKNSPSPAPAAATRLTDEPLVSAYENRLQTLQDTLKERDQVVQMLTQRLEQAADQLDRLQRTGAGRGNAAITSIPPELIENQQTMSEQMTQLLGQWEELHTSEMLTRIESQLTELHKLVSSGGGTPTSVSVISALSAAKEKDTTHSRPKASADASVSSDIPAAEPAKTGWEAIKAAMMAGEEFNPAALSSSAPSSSASLPATREPVVSEAPDRDSVVAAERFVPSPLPDSPPAVDFEIADHQQLCDAIRVRDEFISLLLRRLSSPDATSELPDWDKLNFVPEELHRELLRLRDRLQEKLRVAEVDLSLQRAKQAREEARLSIKADQVARQIRQLGLSPDEVSAPPVSSSRPVNEVPNAAQGRRWLQFLQRSTGNGSGTDGK